MKRLLLLSATLTALILTACSDKSIVNDYDEAEFVQVTLSANSFVSSANNAFRGKSVEFDDSYNHILPDEFTAYFVAKETKGQYNTGDLIQTKTIKEGSNSVTVPKMEIAIYVTNYDEAATLQDNWYTWDNATEQLPSTSHELYLYGKNTINFDSTLSGEVDVHNPYAAVMIKDNEWVTDTPQSYDTNQKYESVSADWYNLYIRLNDTNTKVPIKSVNGNTTYTLKRNIESNRIYQFILNGDVATDTGNLTVNVQPLEKGNAEEIDL